MSETTLCKNYGEYCSNAGIYVGGGFDSSSAMVGGVAKQIVDSTIKSMTKLSKQFEDSLKKAAKTGALSSEKALNAVTSMVKNINDKALTAVDSTGQYMASKVARAMLGGVEETLEMYDAYYGGSVGVDPIITHAGYLIDTYEFIGGASSEILNSLEARVAVFDLYLNELKDVARRLTEIKGADKEKLKHMLEEQYNFISKARDEFTKIKNLVGPSNDVSKKLEELAKHGKVKELKELMKTQNVNKELVDDYITLLRSQGHMAIRAEDINKIIKVIGMTMEQFNKLDTLGKIEDAISVYEKELFKKHGKDKAKFFNALQKVKQLAMGQIGSYDGGVCPCTNSDDSVYNFDPDMYSGGSKCEDYFGGDFLGLEKEVEYELFTNTTIDESDLLRRSFLKSQSQYIAKMLQAAQKAAFEISTKGNFEDNSILLFLFRLKNLNAVKTDELIRVFATHGKDYNSEYMRKAIINDLEDIAEAARAIESKIGPAMKEFASAIEDYKKFLNKNYEENRATSKMTGGSTVNCSGINNGTVYDRFVGGELDLTIEEVISAFNDSILIGRMKNGLNLSLEDLGKFSLEQDKINESVLSKLTNQINASANEMVSKYKEETTFPVKKQLFETVLRNNVRGQVSLQHAAQAMDKKIRMYQKHIIADPLAAKEVADLLSKVTIDTNWMPDEDFSEFKKFCDYFHIESVAKNNNQYTPGNVQVAKQLNGYDPALNHAVGVGVDGNTMNIAGVNYDFQFNRYNDNNYIKQDKYSPLPISSDYCLEYSVPTLVLATADGKFDPDTSKQALKQGNNGKKKAVNHYGGIDIFPAKAYPTDYTGAEAYYVIDSINCRVNVDGEKEEAAHANAYDPNTIPSAIFNPILLPRQVKFLSNDQCLKNYFRALKHAEDGANMLLNLRNLFSIFEGIDDIYKKKSGSSDDGVKIGQIYGAVKQYIILTSMYPVIYKHDDGYKCGFIAMRHFGHDVVVPFEEDEDIRHGNSTSSLMDDLANFELSLREFESGRDFAYNDIADNGSPFPRHDSNNNIVNDGYIKSYQSRFAHEFKARYARFDLLLTMMIKSMYAKIMSVLAMYNLVTFKGQSGDNMDNNLSFAQLRTIYGGDIDSDINKGMYSFVPEVRVECVELYVRLYYYIIFYKQLFMEETSNKVIEQVIALKRFALLPTNDSRFSEIIKLFFLKKFNDKVDSDKFFVNDTDLINYISECNKLYDSESGSERSRFEKIIKDFIRDINQRYGLVKTDSILDVMDKRHKREYPGVQRMSSRADYIDNTKLIKTNRIDSYVKNTLLDGEDSPIGDLGAPSARKEAVSYANTNIESVINPVKTEYKSEELLASVYNFRRKLDKLTEKLTNLFNRNNTNPGYKKQYRESLFSHINSLKQKLTVRPDNMSKFRVLKEYVNDFQSSKIFNIPIEVTLYRELVVNSMNLLYKIYVRIIGNLRIYGIENEWTEPLLRGTYLYYLDSINTDLVKVNRLGKSPVLDFSTLQQVLDRFLGQTREFYQQLSSGVGDSNFNNKVEKVLTTLLNIHRSIFKNGGLVDMIQYEDKQHTFTDAAGQKTYIKSSVKLAAVNDYSEYQHLAHISDAVEGQNSFVLDQMITRYPDPVTARDPRSNILKENIPTLEFELLSKHFSPKNIYVMFEYLLVNIYKIFFERSGVLYGPLMEEFVNSLSHIDIGVDLSKASTTELGGIEYFEDDMPFSTKVVALYKAIYKFNINTTRASTRLTENDLTLLPVEAKESMKKYLPLYLMLFKFIIKQAYLHLGMVTDGAIYEAGDEVRPPLDVLPYTNVDGANVVNQTMLKEIVGAAGFSKEDTINQIISNSESLIKQASKSKTLFTSGVDMSGLNSKIKYDGVQSSTGINGIKSDLLMGAYIKGDPISKDAKESDVFSKFSKVVRSIASGSISKEPSLYDDFMNLRSEIDKFNIGLTRLENAEQFKEFLEDTYKLLDHDHNAGGSQYNLIKTSINESLINNEPGTIIIKYDNEYSQDVKNLYTYNAKWTNAVFAPVVAGANNVGANDADVLVTAAADAAILRVNLGLPAGTNMNVIKEKMIKLITEKILDKRYYSEYKSYSNYMQVTTLRYKNNLGDIDQMTVINTRLNAIPEPHFYADKSRFKRSNYKNTHTLLSLIMRDESVDVDIRSFAKSIKGQLEVCSTPDGKIEEADFRNRSAVLHSSDDVFKNLNKKCNELISGIFSECGNYDDGYYYVTMSTLDIIKTGKGLDSYNKFISFFGENYCDESFYVKYVRGNPVKTLEYEKYEKYVDTYYDLYVIDGYMDDINTGILKTEIKDLISLYRREFSRLDKIKDSYVNINKGYENIYQILTKIIEYKSPLNDANAPATSQKTLIIARVVDGNLREILGKSIPSLYADYNRDLFDKKMAIFESIKTELSTKAEALYKYIINTLRIISTADYPNFGAYSGAIATNAAKGGLQLENDVGHTDDPNYTYKMDLSGTQLGAALANYGGPGGYTRDNAGNLGPEPPLANNAAGYIRQALLYLAAAKNIYIKNAVNNFVNFRTNMEIFVTPLNMLENTGIFDPVFLTNHNNVESPANNNAPAPGVVDNLKRDRKNLAASVNKVSVADIINSVNKLLDFVDSLRLDSDTVQRIGNNINYPNALAAAAPANTAIVVLNANNLNQPMGFNSIVNHRGRNYTFTTTDIDNADIGNADIPNVDMLISDASILLTTNIVNDVIGRANRFVTNIAGLTASEVAADAALSVQMHAAITRNINSINACRVNYNGNKSFNNIYNAIIQGILGIKVYGISNKIQTVTNITQYTNIDRNIGGVFIQRVYFMFNILAFNPRFLYKFSAAVEGVDYDPVPKLTEILMKILLRNTSIYSDVQDDYIQRGLTDIDEEIRRASSLVRADGTPVNERDRMVGVLKAFGQLYSDMLIDNVMRKGVFTGGDELMFHGGVTAGKSTNILNKYADIINKMDINLTGKLFNNNVLYVSALYKIMREKFPQILDADLLTLMGHCLLYLNGDSFSADYHRAIMGVFTNLVENYNIRTNIDKCCNNLDYILEKFFGISISFKGKEKRVFRSNAYDPSGGVALAQVDGFLLSITEDRQNYLLKTDDTFDNSGGPPGANPPDIFNTIGSNPISKENIVARAKNAIKYATIIYKSLHKVYTSVAEKPKYLGLAPYISDVYEIIGKEDTVAPLSFAVDVIPTICNTVDGMDEKNILKSMAENVTRKGLGLHCNNIFEIEKLFGEKSELLDAVGLFLLDDKLHSITINDFPHFKSLLSTTNGSDIIRSNISQASINNYITDFGRLTKYLYEIDFKNMFANSFPVFNSLDNPKYFIRSATHYELTFNEFGSPIVGNSLKNALPTILGYDSELFLHRENGYRGSFLEIISANANVTNIANAAAGGHSPNPFANTNLLYNVIKDPKMLLTALELRTNNKDILDYISYVNGAIVDDSGIGNYKSNTITDKSEIMMKNILDVGIMPININSMMREIPLANTINGVYSFDIIIDWLQKKFKESNIGTAPISNFTPREAQRFTTHSALKSNLYELKYSNYLKNPLGARMIPINKSLTKESVAYSSCFGNDVKGLPKGKAGLKEFNGIYAANNIFSKLLPNIAVTQANQTRYLSNMTFSGNASISKLNYSVNIHFGVNDKYDNKLKKYNVHQFGAPSSIFDIIDKLSVTKTTDASYVTALTRYEASLADAGFAGAVDNLIARNISSSVGNSIYYHFREIAYNVMIGVGADGIAQGAAPGTRSNHFNSLLNTTTAAGDILAINALMVAYVAFNGAGGGVLPIYAVYVNQAHSLLVLLLAITHGKSRDDCLRYASMADLLTIANVDRDIANAGLSQPVNYNYFPSFVDNKGYLLNSKLLDIGITQFADKSKLVGKLVGELPEKVIYNAAAAVPAFEYKLPEGTYYNNQITYTPTRDDLYGGVDPDLQMPVLGVNIYSDILLDLYKREFQYRYTAPSKVYKPDTFSRGINSLYNSGPR